ncbi:MAG: sigma-54-dependent Fis family transcriptional regulator [Desulfobacula sp.]|uniref:sigma-54-dependent transcriptional regulator n=1 Tax=Desulfobacula sp. TaxID=2593537 RepID=UPI001D9480E1|nr:sigma-54-dependent Fis family transcriptional regulator [Desulfobacula sp.]MBT3484349.1 sigma-54-dependent Fis family transcriptional regulator [Desulfobacula sp.]MBT3806198.1 sigma-54-dependent Fis family transcriptional regulator [Desulfobacula sp.]MBT4024158.1 sigma-54-dependent Fis family transcriptional regulator [Desulfobacula sp.]MBT4197482.1 sigma-54-dependent Fis family transcriptional regulator [Desulfobacula sp.]
MNKQKSQILIVDDDKTHRNMLKTLLNKWGYALAQADDGQTAIDMVTEKAYDLVLMDIKMIKVSGLVALKEIKKINPAIPVIIMTAFSSIDTAVEALKNGAYDYLTKPFDFDKLKITILRSLEHTQLKKENFLLKETLGKNFDCNNIIGKNKKMQKLIQTISQVAKTDATVLINGESGTGKELIAGAIHYNSLRKQGPFIKINCAAITETLLESELFGHEKGAFTGASRSKEGKFQQADKGSILLDEISETSMSMQVKLLRTLQEREVTPVGSEKVIKVDTRIIAATNKNLIDLIAKGDFREDLYYRLNVINLSVPPLRQRSGDIQLLSQHFLKLYAKKNNRIIKGFTPEAMEKMAEYHWPGNVRELMNTLERSVILSTGDFLSKDDIQIEIGSPLSEASHEDAGQINLGGKTLYEVEKLAILKMLDKTENNKSKTARQLGISRRTLHLKLKDYGVMP